MTMVLVMMMIIKITHVNVVRINVLDILLERFRWRIKNKKK